MAENDPEKIRLGGTDRYVPSGLWPGSSPEVIAAHERTLGLVGPVDDGSGTDLPRNPVIAWLGVVFLLALGAVCLAGGRALDEIPGVRLEGEDGAQAKYEYFAREKDRFEAVFVGSSQVYRHLLPALFDRRMNRNGHRIRSFNFGMPGMQFPEILYAVDFVLEQEPRRLEYVFIELKPLGPNVQEVNELSRREIHWHTPRAYPEIVATTLAQDEPLSTRLWDLKWHTAHTLYRFGNVAMALPVFERALGLHSITGMGGYTEEGALPIDIEVEFRLDLRVRRQAYLDSPGILEERLEALRSAPRQGVLQPHEERILLDLIDRVRAHGAEPVFFLAAPGWRAHPEFLRAARDGVLPVLFAYNDPDRYPQFYDPDVLFDISHMKTEGAELFTLTLAEDFSAWLEKKGVEPTRRPRGRR